MAQNTVVGLDGTNNRRLYNYSRTAHQWKFQYYIRTFIYLNSSEIFLDLEELPTRKVFSPVESLFEELIDDTTERAS